MFIHIYTLQQKLQETRNLMYHKKNVFQNI